MFSEDDLKDTPSIVIGAIACGVAPIPFLVVYAFIFLMHGTIFPVDPPDITSSRLGEALSGIVALLYLAVIVMGIGWFLGQYRRWFFLLGQTVSCVAATWFLMDKSSGDPEVPLMLVITTVAAIILGLMPTSYHYVHDWRYEDGKAPVRVKIGGRTEAQASVVADGGDSPFAEANFGSVGNPVDPNSGG